MTPPAWVHKRDGRLVAFEADKISRSLFAATEELGRPDAFLARELTDGVLHFLSLDAVGQVPSTADVAEMVEKVVRELGQRALATAYSGFAAGRASGTRKKSERSDATSAVSVPIWPGQPFSNFLADCRRAYTLNVVFTRDLVAAEHDGLLTLAGVDAPPGLAASAPAPPTPLLERLLEARQHTSGVVALDGVEHALTQSSHSDESAAATFARELEIGLQGTGLEAVVNLNIAAPPAWADGLADGPLFAGKCSDAGRLAALGDALLPAIARGSAPARIDWHLSQRDFAPTAAERLRRVARLVAEGAAVALVFDRPRRPVALAEGIDRRHPALLLTVGVNLPRLAGQSGVGADPALFLQKLGSLARLALSAAVQKREFLRRHAADHPMLTRGFLLDRARLMVAPVGLDATVWLVTGKRLCDAKGAELGRQVVQRLRDVLREDGHACLVDSCLDAPAGFRFDEVRIGPELPVIAGATPWEAATPKAQLRAAGALHAVAEGGSAALLLDGEHPPGADQIVEWLRLAWSQSEVGRVCLVRPAPAHRQLTLAV
jgi:hypothetical protein